MKRVAFVPARIADNPAVDKESYTANLMHLPPVTRERLLEGDWTILPTGLIKPEYLRYYSFRGNSDICHLLKTIIKDDGSIIHTDEIIYEFDIRQTRRIITIDTAGGVKEVEAAAKNKQLSYTAMGCFDYKRWGQQGKANQALLVRGIRRGKGWSYPEIKSHSLSFHQEWNQEDHRVQRVRVEDKALGVALAQDLKGKMPIDTISTQGQDKIQRATKMLNMFAAGEIYLPRYNSDWLPSYEGEMLSIQGLADETNDQFDITAYAAIEVSGPFQQTITLPTDPRKAEPLTPKLFKQW